MSPGMMQTEIPSALHRRVKIMAVTEGRQIREIVAEALEVWLAARAASAAPAAALAIGESVTTGTPVRSIAEPMEIAPSPNPFAPPAKMTEEERLREWGVQS